MSKKFNEDANGKITFNINTSNPPYPSASSRKINIPIALIVMILVVILLGIGINRSNQQNNDSYVNENNILQDDITSETYQNETSPIVTDVWLTDLPYLKKDEDVYIINDNIGQANTKEEYTHYMYSRSPYSEVVYQLNRQYDTLTALWAVCFSDRDVKYSSSFAVYADEEIVYESNSITGGDLPIEINVDIHYCNLLTIQFREGTGAGELGNILLSNSVPISYPETQQEVGVIPVWLTDLDYLKNEDVVIISKENKFSNHGTVYSHFLYSNHCGNIEYYLAGKYNRLSGVWSICYNDRGGEVDTSEGFEIYADNQLIYSSPLLSGDDSPVEIDIDIRYCEKLKISFVSGTGWGELGNIKLSAR